MSDPAPRERPGISGVVICFNEQDRIARCLESLSFCDELVVAGDGYDGMRLATTQHWALIILDLRLPGPDGLEICRAIRKSAFCSAFLASYV